MLPSATKITPRNPLWTVSFSDGAVFSLSPHFTAEGVSEFCTNRIKMSGKVLSAAVYRNTFSWSNDVDVVDSNDQLGMFALKIGDTFTVKTLEYTAVGEVEQVKNYSVVTPFIQQASLSSGRIIGRRHSSFLTKTSEVTSFTVTPNGDVDPLNPRREGTRILWTTGPALGERFLGVAWQ